MAKVVYVAQAPYGGGRSYRRRRIPAKYKKAYQAARKMKRKYPKKDYAWIKPIKRGTITGYVGTSYANAEDDEKAFRKAIGYYGRGDYYKGGFTRALRTFGRRALGHGLGLADRTISNFTGRGDYGPASTNQLMGGAGGEAPLTVNSSNDLTGDIYFSHREFVRNISVEFAAAGTSPFQITSFPINPGMECTFPFLSQLAQNFSLYDLIGCIFEYRPTSGEFGSSSSNALGKVIMATNYDPNARPFSSAIQMENYDYANSCKPSIGAIHGVETAPAQRSVEMLYIRTGATNEKDRVFTDLGTFQLATEGISSSAAGTSVIGELWVTYKVKLSRANLFSALLGNNIGFDALYGFSNAVNMFNGSSAQMNAEFPTWVSDEIYLPTTVSTSSMIPKASNSIGLTVTAVNGNLAKVQFPNSIVAGTYKFELQVMPTVAPASNITVAISTLNKCTQVGTSTQGILSSIQGSTKRNQIPSGAVVNTTCTWYVKLDTNGAQNGGSFFFNTQTTAGVLTDLVGCGFFLTCTEVCTNCIAP